MKLLMSWKFLGSTGKESRCPAPQMCVFLSHLSTQGRASPQKNMEPKQMDVLGRWHMFLFKAICFLGSMFIVKHVWMNVFDTLQLQGTSHIPPWDKEYHLQKSQTEGDVSIQINHRWVERLHMYIGSCIRPVYTNIYYPFPLRLVNAVPSYVGFPTGALLKPVETQNVYIYILYFIHLPSFPPQI